MRAEVLHVEDSTLRVLCSTTRWKVLAPAVRLALDWTKRRQWQAQRFPFGLSGQRTLIIQCNAATALSAKIKGHHLVRFEPTATPMLFHYGTLQRPTLRPFSRLAAHGPWLPSGHAVNAGWWSHKVSVGADLKLSYTPPAHDAPCGAMRLDAARYELEMVRRAHQRGCSPFFPVAYGRYRGAFDGTPTGFNVIAGPFGRDVRANALFKGAVLSAGRRPSVWLATDALGNVLARFTGRDQATMQIATDRYAIRKLWITAAQQLGGLLRCLHASDISHGAADFGNLVVVAASRSAIDVALCDWEDARDLRGLTPTERLAACLEDILYPVHALLLEERNNPFFASIASAAELTQAIFRGFAGASPSRSAAPAAVNVVNRLIGAAKGGAAMSIATPRVLAGLVSMATSELPVPDKIP